MRRRNVSKGRKVIGILLIVAIALTVFSFIVMQLWNNILTPVLHVQPVNFWQALGIFVLSKILFGGFRGGWGGPRNQWRRRMYENWENMTPEQREKFREQWRNRCGGNWRNSPRQETRGHQEKAGAE